MATNEVVVQLAKFNDKTSNNNSEWNNHLNEGVTINEGDEILVSKGFIDTRNLASNNIVITEDTPLELEFYFYWINDSNPGDKSDGMGNLIKTTSPGKTGNAWWQFANPLTYPGEPGKYSPYGDIFNSDFVPPKYSVQVSLQSEKNILFNNDNVNQQNTAGPNILNANQNVLFADGRPYVMCYTDNSPYTKKWNYTLKAGSYSPDQLASLLTEAMAEVSKDTATELENSTASNWFSNGQPFISNTASYPPVWAVCANTRDDAHHTPPDYQYTSIVDSQPYLQIDECRGLPTATDWKTSTTGSSQYYDPVFNEDSNGLGPPIQTASGLPVNKSLTFKNFISDAPTPTPAQNLPVLPDSTAISADKMVLNGYYKIVTLGDTLWKESGDTASTPAINDEFLCIKPGTLPGTPTISVSEMVNGFKYVIETLGNSWNGEYDTNWLGLSTTLTSPTIGETFTCQDNTSIQFAFEIPSEIDTTNTFTFTLCNGYNLSTIGGPSLPSNPTPTEKDIISTCKQNDWITISTLSPNFIGRNDNGINYTLFMGATQTTIPTIGTQFIASDDGTNYVNVALNSLTDLNVVPIGMKLEVTTSGGIEWNLLGHVNPNPIIGVNDNSIVIDDNYSVSSLGITYGIANAKNDTNWNTITAGIKPNPILNEEILVTIIAVNENYTNATIYNVNDFAVNYANYENQRIIIVSMGTSIESSWIQYTTEFEVDIGTILQINPSIAGSTSLNGSGATFQILENGYLAEGMKILVTLADKIDWSLYTGSAVNSGDIITLTDIPDYKSTITNSGTSFLPMTDTFQVIPTGLIQSLDITTPFTFIVSKIPAIPFVATDFVANVVPIETGTTTINYTLPLQPFIPNSVMNSSIVVGANFSANVKSTGSVKLTPFTQGTCSETFNPDFPNFYIYPLVLKQFLNELSYYPPSDQIIDAFWGGPCMSYGFPIIGSTEIELAFDDTKNRFIWNYTHSPIQQGEAPTSQTTSETTFSNVVGIINSFDPVASSSTGFQSSVCKLTAQSGLMFKSMNPPNFWNKVLGFSTDLLVSDDDLGLTSDGSLKPLGINTSERFTYERFNSITTRDILSTAMNFNDSANFPNAQPSYIDEFRSNTAQSGQIVGPVQLMYEPVIDTWSANEIGTYFMKVMNTNGMDFKTTPPEIISTPTLNAEWFQALDETITIQAINNPVLMADEYGHYLISITGYGDDKNGLLNETMKVDSKAIVSNYYVNQGSFVSVTFPDSQVYTHIGESITLNNFGCRIIDPENMQSVLGLGENSCIYIQINKQYGKQELSQTSD